MFLDHDLKKSSEYSTVGITSNYCYLSRRCLHVSLVTDKKILISYRGRYFSSQKRRKLQRISQAMCNQRNDANCTHLRTGVVNLIALFASRFPFVLGISNSRTRRSEAPSKKKSCLDNLMEPKELTYFWTLSMNISLFSWHFMIALKRLSARLSIYFAWR